MFRILKTPTTTCWSARINRSQLKLNQRILLDCQTASWLKSRPTFEFQTWPQKKKPHIESESPNKANVDAKMFPAYHFWCEELSILENLKLTPSARETLDRKWERLHTTPQRVAMPKIIKASLVGFRTKKKDKENDYLKSLHYKIFCKMVLWTLEM